MFNGVVAALEAGELSSEDGTSGPSTWYGK